eukprot:CAMPEP_0117527730 /NCGR_PEP_ID=MMETSP0784-20121206/36948_1 /TAXON_ID=39447 /ORGANISM="" /LENGTH=137 /DNA_ID=CAMNT_0005323991 /DNA_START=176 /DNA_END=589 /DNA_ORIENTATION=-
MVHAALHHQVHNLVGLRKPRSPVCEQANRVLPLPIRVPHFPRCAIVCEEAVQARHHNVAAVNGVSVVHENLPNGVFRLWRIVAHREERLHAAFMRGSAHLLDPPAFALVKQGAGDVSEGTAAHLTKHAWEPRREETT